ncbi:MAG: hypothetical protein A2W19_08570 [Spirochaetes bacterium RBG_16_49_21]|nr:MAG: hypothetical protein A2W19_08570 [Spirochaetes bacterium RBG_16_49_21]
MLGKDVVISDANFDGIDYAAKLIRIPDRTQTGAKAGGSSFDDAVNKVLGKEHGSGIIEKEKGAGKDKKLMDTCIQMESLLVAKMLKEMRTTVHKTGWIDGGFAESIFEDMLYDEYALSLSKNSNLGLANMLYDQLKGRSR